MLWGGCGNVLCFVERGLRLSEGRPHVPHPSNRKSVAMPPAAARPPSIKKSLDAMKI